MSSFDKQHRFVIKAFFKNVDCVTAMQRAFHTRFGLNPNKSNPDRKTVMNWVKKLRTTKSIMPKTPTGLFKSINTPQNISAVRASIEQSPSRSARKNASALRISVIPTGIARFWRTFTPKLQY